jgi:hypothetical protein
MAASNVDVVMPRKKQIWFQVSLARRRENPSMDS